MANMGGTASYLAKKYVLRGPLGRIPLVGTFARRYLELQEIARACGYRPGHYYSPIPSREEVNSRREKIFGEREILDVDLNVEGQRELLAEFRSRHAEFPYDFLGGREREDLRYRFTTRPQYRYSDVVFLYHVMRHLRPRRVVEIGSGASSAVMLDVNDLFFDSSIRFTFIEPYPDRLYGFLDEGDRDMAEVVEAKVQDVSMAVFEALGENDILFVDSSHVSKVGSDVNHIIFEILPRLREGVWIHFHDVFYPFEMPSHWILKYGRFWNENYIIRAFLMNNDAYEIMVFNTLLHKKYRSWFEENMPECLVDPDNTGSLWLRKVKA